METHILGTLKTNENTQIYDYKGNFDIQNQVIEFIDNDNILTKIDLINNIIIRKLEEYIIKVDLNQKLIIIITLNKTLEEVATKIELVSLKKEKSYFYVEYILEENNMALELTFGGMK